MCRECRRRGFLEIFWPVRGSETSVCGILLGCRAYSEGFIFWFTKSFALRNEVSMLGHLVSAPGCEVHTSRWMLFAWMPVLRAHVGRVSAEGRWTLMDFSYMQNLSVPTQGSSSILIFVLISFCFPIIFLLLNACK